MFRPSCRSPFSLTDLDMWDTKSRFTAQSSAWCGMAAVSGTGFLSKVSTSTSASGGSFRQSEPGLRKWQSLSHLAPEGPTRSFSPSPGAELRAARGASFRQAEVGQWLQDAHEWLDTHRSSQLSSNNTAQLLDMKHKQQSEAMSALEQEKEEAEFSKFGRSRRLGELNEKVQHLEKELLQMRSTLDRGSKDQSAGRRAASLGRTSPVSQEDVTRQEKQEVDIKLCELREALRAAEAKAETQEEERNQALQKLRTSAEKQKALLSQVEEMNQRFTHLKQNHSEVQEQLSEANNKISQACLEKAILSTQVLKLEDDIKELMAQQTRPPQETVIQADNKQETAQMKEESKALKEVNEKLTRELEMTKQDLNTSQSQLQEVTAESLISSEQITDLKAERSQLIREKEELSQTNEARHEELTEMREQCCQLRDSVEVLESDKVKLQDRCLCLEAEVLEKEERLHLQEEEFQRQNAARVQSTEELKAVAKHWTEKWQKAALTLQSAQEELQELKRKNSRNETESESLLKVELEAGKQQLELERSRTLALLHICKDKGGEAAVQTQDKDTATDLSQSSLSWEPPDSHSSQNKPPQEYLQSSEVQRLKQKLAEREKELRDKEEALKSLERLREREINEAQLKISAPELKVSGEARDDGGQEKVSSTESLRAQLEESRRQANQLEQEKALVVQKIQTLRQLHPVKDEKPLAEDKRDKTVCAVDPDTEQQRRMVTEQLKSLFKEREGKEVGKVDNRPAAAAQTGASSLQDRTPTAKVMKSAVDRRSWQCGSGLMPVFEEDEESSDLTGQEGHAEENCHNQNRQMSTVSAGISCLKAKHENLLQATLRRKQLNQDCLLTARQQSETFSSVDVPNLPHSSDEIDLQQTTPSFYPDGIFLAELIDICSPDEDEEDK